MNRLLWLVTLCVPCVVAPARAAELTQGSVDWFGKDPGACKQGGRFDAAKASLAVAMATELGRLEPTIDLGPTEQGVVLSVEGLSRCERGCPKTRAILEQQWLGAKSAFGGELAEAYTTALASNPATAIGAAAHQLTLTAGPLQLDAESCGKHYVFQLDDLRGRPFTVEHAQAMAQQLCFFGGGSCGSNPYLAFRTTSVGCPEGRTCIAIDPTDGDNGTPTDIDVVEGAFLNDVAPFSAPSGQFTVVPYTAEQTDTFNEYDPQTATLTAVQTGVYRVCAALASFTGVFELDLFIDGARENAFAMSMYGAATGCREVMLNQGNTLTVRVYQGSVASMFFGSNSLWNWLQIQYMQPFYADLVVTDNIAQFTAPANQFTKAPFNAVVYDYGRFDQANSRYVAQSGGDYEICASVAGFSNDFELDVFANENRIKAFTVSRNGVAQGCTTVYLSAGSYADVRLYQNSVANLTFTPNSIWSWLTVREAWHFANAWGSTFTASSGVFTKVPYSIGSAGNGYDPATSRFTAWDENDIFVCASLASFTGVFELDLFVNGARSRAIAVSNYGAATGCGTVRVHPGDTIEVWVHQASGAPMTFAQNSLWSWVSISRAFLTTVQVP